MLDWSAWRHVFKLDPDKPISDEALEAICCSGSHAVVVGGTQNIRYEQVADLLSRLRRYSLPCLLEVSDQKAIVPGFDHYLIPIVLNAENPEWILKPHVEAIKTFGSLIPWHDLTPVGYLVLNPHSAVARLTQSRTNLDEEEVLAFGRLAAHLLKLPCFYLEYSGAWGNAELVCSVARQLKQESGIHLFYGGGIASRREAEVMLQGVDTIVVGNIIYADLDKALETVPHGHQG
jgi:putative glycerol-1-phosphate prenyltransferase